MRIAVLGDSLLDLEVSGSIDGICPEAPINIFKGLSYGIFPGGGGNVATLLSETRVTVDLYCQGPGQKDKALTGTLFKQVCKAQRIIWSNSGWVPLKIRGVDEKNDVICRIDAEEVVPDSPFPALYALLDDIDRYDAVVISDYLKGTVCASTEQVIVDILKRARVSVVDSKRHDYSMWKHATCIVPNKHEAIDIFGTTDPLEIRRMAGCKAVFVTRGGDGVLLSYDGDETCCEIAVLESIDNPYTVGAGDSFAVGIVMALAQGCSFPEAGMLGVKYAQAYVKRGRKSQLR